MQYIVTYSPKFKRDVLAELSKIDKDLLFVKDINKSIMIVQIKINEAIFIKKLKATAIFTKHIMPVLSQGQLYSRRVADLEVVDNYLERLAKLRKGEKFSVQCRIVNGGYTKKLDYTSKDIEVYVGNSLKKKGAIPVFDDEHIINENVKIFSVLIYKNTSYLGVSMAEDNLNFHSDEYRVLESADNISRAENKLKEALAYFKLDLKRNGLALDVGAAPGGWSKVLADYGYDVVAVSPGELAPQVKSNPKISHMSCRIENIKFCDYFDLVVNDMNISPAESANVMVGLCPCLKKGADAIMTIRLPRGAKGIEEAKAVLSKCYKIVKIKSLFHNRQEVTAHLKKK